MTNYETLLKSCEDDIRSGRAVDAARRLSKASPGSVPRPLRLLFANLCRRAGLSYHGLKALGPIVYPKKKRWRADATAAELAEYAVLLDRTGASQEALWLLERIPPSEAPEVMLYRAYVHIASWNYRHSIQDLNRYLAGESDPYKRLVANVNLASSHLGVGQTAEAEALIAQNILESTRLSHNRLLANSFELRAQLRILNRDFKGALADLESSAAILGASQTQDQLFVQKWLAVIEATETDSSEPIVRLRALAERRQNQETVREADRLLLKIEFDRGRFEHLIFGTSHPSYRRRLVDELGRSPETSYYLLGDAGGPVMDMTTGQIQGLGSRGEVTGKMHLMFEALLRDFYRPIRLGGLFAALFPDEHFDIFSSPHRVHQIIYRCRHWIARNGFPIEISESFGNYSLRRTGEFGFLVPLERMSVERPALILQSLRAKFGGPYGFTARAAREHLDISSGTFQRFLTWAVAEGHLQRTGQNKATRYRVAV